MKTDKTIRIFIGQDDVENASYHVLANSIIRNSSVPVSITPIKRTHLKDVYDRPEDPRSSNEFTYIRFLVPYLCGYEGMAIFMDCDMLVTADIAELAAEFNGNAVSCVQHDYVPKDRTKFLGAIQYAYPRKNWSSVMMFDCSKCEVLTPEYVNKASPAALHRMTWADGDIGSLSKEWNWLVGEYPPNPEAKLLHYTVGGPWFDEYRDTDHAKEWMDEMYRTMAVVQRDDLEVG